jgi:peptidoglycan/LPS O-acetylase OafA/YrhL
MKATGLLAHRDDLDGLRGLAIGLVMIDHAEFLPTTSGFAGVTAFFVLSGYLITGTLLREKDDSGIRLRAFYGRRLRRLAPALLVLLLVVVALGVAGIATPWFVGAISSLTYTANWAMSENLGLMGHAWSLSIEEQFYVLWPLVMIVTPRTWLMPIALAGAIAGLLIYVVVPGVEFATFSNGGAILLGCAVAIWGGHLPKVAGSLGVALIVTGAIFTSQLSAALGGALVVTTAVRELTPLAPIGRRAYSLYLWSWPMRILFGAFLGIFMTVIVAEMSYRFVERRFLLRRQILETTPVTAAVDAG